jgi:hypothetical protein
MAMVSWNEIACEVLREEKTAARGRFSRSFFLFHFGHANPPLS